MALLRRAALLLLVLILALPGLTALARPARAAAPSTIGALDLIAGVNALRASHGLAPLKVHPSLMASAQGQADYMASLSLLSHTGPGGSLPIDRARAAGYGGGAWIAIAENIALFPQDTPNMLSAAVLQAWADDLHLNTMLNTGLQHAGAGIAVSNGMVYITLDTGWIAGPPLISETPTVSGTPPTRTPVTLIPYVRLLTSTPMPDGSVYHIVGYGQVLVNIAAAYGVKLNDLASLNRITPDKIYDGQKLLIRPSSTSGPPGQASAPNKGSSPTPPAASPGPPPDALADNGPGASLAFATPVPGLPPAALADALALAATPSPTVLLPAPPPPAPLTTNQIAILVTVACGVLGVILVSLRRK
jgi:LysM repeat protein